MNISKIDIKSTIIEILEIILGATIMAAATSLFLLPNQLSTGGLTGIATIIYYLLKVPVGTTILIFNIPLFIFTIYRLGKKFAARSIVGTIVYSIALDLFDNFSSLTQDRFLACIYGGILVGLGTAIILKGNSSTGGSDLVSSIVKTYKPDLKMGYLITILDTLVVALNVLFFKEIEIGLYSAIAIFLMGKVIDIVFEGVNFTKLLIIVSNKNEEIAKQIGEKIQKGATGLFGKGMYTDENKLVLMCAASRGDVAKVKEVARKIDKQSFIIVTNAREVMGLGFK